MYKEGKGHFPCSYVYSTRLAINFAKHDILGADDSHNIGHHVVGSHEIQRRQMREAGRLDLAAVRLG